MGTPNYPLLMASGVAAIVASLIGSAMFTGALPALAARQKAAAVNVAKVCANCGVIASVKKRGLYDITVQMDDGRLVTLSQSDKPALEEGARVRINGDVLVRG